MLDWRAALLNGQRYASRTSRQVGGGSSRYVRGQLREAGKASLRRSIAGDNMLSTIRTTDNMDDGFEAWFARVRGPHRLVQLNDAARLSLGRPRVPMTIVTSLA